MMAMGLELLEEVLCRAILSLPTERACATYTAVHRMKLYSETEDCTYTQVDQPNCLLSQQLQFLVMSQIVMYKGEEMSTILARNYKTYSLKIRRAIFVFEIVQAIKCENV